MPKYNIIAQASFGSVVSTKAKLELVPDFDLVIKVIKDKPTFVPFGIPAFDGTNERGFIEFEVEVLKHGIDSFEIEVLCGNNVIYTGYSDKMQLSTVTVTAAAPRRLSGTTSTPPSEAVTNYPVGKYISFWDGFDQQDVYDSAIFIKETFKIRVKGKLEGKEKIAETQPFKFQYDEVRWVDTKIDRGAKKIDVTLRLNLLDGKEYGIECVTYKPVAMPVGPSMSFPDQTVCPWDKIPKLAVTTISQAPLQIRTKSFNDLKQLVFDGFKRHWGRNCTIPNISGFSPSGTRTVGTGINIGSETYEVFVDAVNNTNSSITMNDIPLAYNTNGSPMRSGNTGGSYDDKSNADWVMEKLPNGWIQRIAYNVGYLYHSDWKDWNVHSDVYKTKGWGYKTDADAAKSFSRTAAHEIGHEILQAYAGTTYSWQHKGSSYFFPQNTKPTARPSAGYYSDFMRDVQGEDLPMTSLEEIDLMKYYNTPLGGVSDYYDRSVSDEIDVLSFIWLAKLAIL